jgi:beta-1,2-mannobiose phosphorylase / 1,2-beta-oligomannan phosphorylase
MEFPTDKIVFGPDDVDLRRSPLRASLDALDVETYVLGAFNPGMTRLPNGNLLLMVRVAEALKEPLRGGFAHAIRATPARTYVLDAYPMSSVDLRDPRKIELKTHAYKTMALTSLSWLLPVECSADGLEVLYVHYDKIIAPEASYQEYGVEDARISLVGGTYFMTACAVGAERHGTCLYTSTDGLNYLLLGLVLDHQNKDMLYFEGKIGGKFWALTRPLGDLYFLYPPDSPFHAGPSINLATSPDGLHWRPHDAPFIRPRKDALSTMKIGGGTPPILTPKGWLMLYHGVAPKGMVGIYRTFWALLDADDPSRVLRFEDDEPLLEARPDLSAPLRDKIYLTDVVFTTGIADHGEYYVAASGELDLACRITHIPKSVFA